MRILLIEDDQKIAPLIINGLNTAGYTTDHADTGKEACEKIKINEYDLIILDLTLPDGDGIEWCTQMRKADIDIPTLMLTARSGIEDRVKGLDSGADDYLVKPFSMPELLARCRALLRRDATDKLAKVVVGDLILDVAARRVKRGAKEIDLNNKEFSLLHYMAINRDRVVSRTDILEHVWGERGTEVMTNTIDVHIRFLRRKIDEPFKKKLIKTVRGSGYMLTAS